MNPQYFGLETHFNENVTFYKDVSINGNLNYDSLSVKTLTVEQQSSLGITTTTNLYAQDLNVFNTSTFGTIKISSGIITSTTGITTYYGDGSNLKIDGNAISSLTPPGTIISYASTIAPVGYLKCNDAAISRNTYSSLFSNIGTTYGSGDGSTTFNVPDLRGEFIRGWDDNCGIDPGRVIGSAQVQDYQSHGHGVIDPGHSHSVNFDVTQGSNATTTFAYNGVSAFALRNTNANTTGITIQNSGGTETRPRNVAILYCIKY